LGSKAEELPYLSLEESLRSGPFYKLLKNLPVSSFDGTATVCRKRASGFQSMNTVDILRGRVIKQWNLGEQADRLT
jgi:hypothetical protein